MTKEAAATTAIHLLADRTDLIEAVKTFDGWNGDIPPEPIERDWWHAATVREAGRRRLPMTGVASNQSGAQGAVGFGQFEIEELRDRSPWVLGMAGSKSRSTASWLCQPQRWSKPTADPPFATQLLVGLPICSVLELAE